MVPEQRGNLTTALRAVLKDAVWFLTVEADVVSAVAL